MKILGIDPGRQGGYALIEGKSLVAHGQFCLHPDKIDVAILYKHATDLTVMAFERTTSLPRFSHPRRGAAIDLGGSKTNWLRGYSAGFLQGWAEAMNIERVIAPSAPAWQKVMLDGVPGANTKLQSIWSAKSFYPEAELKTPAGRVLDGVADAINIAVYAQRILISEGLRD